MKFPFLASCILFILVLHRAINRNNKIYHKEEASFWEKEAAANGVRKQPLDNLEYISFPAEMFSLQALLKQESYPQFTEENPRVFEIEERFRHLSEQKIVNLSQYTNTDLKMQFGVGNLMTLTEYDANYSELITLLQEYAQLLHTNNYSKEALTVLEYAISIGSDIGASYELCARLYQESNTSYKIPDLLEKARTISSIRGPSIVRKLQKFDQYSG